MKAEIYTCDGCGTQKKETNHWYKVALMGDFFAVGWWDWVPSDLKTFGGHPMAQEHIIRVIAVRHYCGHQCLHKFLDKTLPLKVAD